MVATVDLWAEVYWPGLKAQLDLISTDLYGALKTSAAAEILNYDTSRLTADQILRVQALLICVPSAGMPGLAGWSEERHQKTLKIDTRTWTKTEGLDAFIGELRTYLPAWTDKNIKTTNDKIFQVFKTNSIFLAPKLDQRDQVFRDKELADERTNWDEYGWDWREP